MREVAFRKFLKESSTITSKTKAVDSRMAKAKWIENKFCVDLDNVVDDDDKMYDILISIKNEGDPSGNKQNALRKYYEFKNDRVFPRLIGYK